MIIRVSLWFGALVLLNALVELQSVSTWNAQPLFPPTKIPEGALSPSRPTVRRKIVLYHNYFRNKVRPTASNMLLMSWHAGAARQAQEYAERCVYLQHNAGYERALPFFGSCGQNLFVASHKTPWFFAIKEWFIEYQKFTYGAPIKNLTAVGHYTQMVWAMSYKVGCGIAHCSGGPWGQFYNFVCHYCPGGNIDTIVQYPYKVGEPCGDCPDHCVSGLCTNACMDRDEVSNCAELYQINKVDLCRQTFCNATCICGTKLHKNYPFL